MEDLNEQDARRDTPATEGKRDNTVSAVRLMLEAEQRMAAASDQAVQHQTDADHAGGSLTRPHSAMDMREQSDSVPGSASQAEPFADQGRARTGARG